MTTLDDLYSSDDLYSVQSSRSSRSSGGDGFTGERTIPYYQTVDGLLRRTWITKNQDENYQNEVLYLYALPELRTNTDRKVAPPVSNPPFLTSAVVHRGEDTPYGVHTKFPADLREVPISMVPGVEDGTIVNTFKPGRWNVHPETGRIKQENRHYLLIVRQYKDYDPEVGVLACAPQELERLATSLQFHLQYRDNLIGVPIRLHKTQAAVDVQIVKDRDELDMSDFPTHDENGAVLLHKHNATVRAEYEKFLLNSGVWTADDVDVEFTDKKGVTHTIATRHNWRMVGAAEQGFVEPKSKLEETTVVVDSPAEVIDEPPFEVDGGKPQAAEDDGLDAMTAAQLRDLAKSAGIKIRPNDNRKKVIEAIRAQA